MTFLCFCLSGCAGIVSTNLKNVSAQPDESRLLKSVGYVVYPTTDGNIGNSGKDGTASWVHALADFTNMENIFFFEDGEIIGAIHSYEEFSKTHPMVSIELKGPDPKEKMEARNEPALALSMLLTTVSLGIIPSYYSEPYKATFTLSMPEEKHVPDLQWNYEYRRQMYLWILLLPFSNYTISPTGEGEGSHDRRWETEEKRRLLLKFLADAKQSLQAH